jgi:peptidoglycan/xylan/chitin deacetylase (PgdA/CDA1 family)
MLLLPILSYHHVGVRAEPFGHSRLWVSSDRFSQHLAFLAEEGYRCLTLRDCIPYLSEDAPLLHRAIVLTFDDGYADFISHAYPILKQYGFPATVAVVTGAVGHSSRWDVGWESPIMTWPDIIALSRDGIEFASHTVSHPHLTHLPSGMARQELEDSRLTLEAKIAMPVTTLIYPYGDVNEEIEGAARIAGYAAACSDVRGNRHRPWERLRLKRVPMDEFVTVDRLSQRLSSFYGYRCLAGEFRQRLGQWKNRLQQRA